MAEYNMLIFVGAKFVPKTKTGSYKIPLFEATQNHPCWLSLLINAKKWNKCCDKVSSKYRFNNDIIHCIN